MKNNYKLQTLALFFALLFSVAAKSQCTANFTYTVNSNGSVSFTNLSSPVNSNTYYQWNFGDNQFGYTASPTHVYGGNGSYLVILHATDSITPCNATYSAMITVTNVACAVNAGLTYTVNSGGVVHFANTTTGTVSGTYYQLHYGDNSTNNLNSSFNTVNHTYAASGNYTVTLTANNNSVTCYNTYSTVISVSVTPCTLTAGFTYTVNNGTVNFSNTSTGVSPTATYYWSFGNSTNYYGANPPAQTYVSNGNYQVTLHINDSITTNCNSTAIHTVNITNAPCVATSNFTMFKDSNVVSSIVWNAYPTYPSNVSNVVWNWGDNSSSTGLYPSHTYSASGFYNICLTVSVSCGSSTTTCLNTNIYRSSSTNQVATVNVINNLVTGIAKNNASGTIRLFPNPVKDILTIENSAADFNVVVTDLYGKVVYTKSHSANDSKVDLQNLNSGIYFVKVSGADYSKSIKIIKE